MGAINSKINFDEAIFSSRLCELLDNSGFDKKSLSERLKMSASALGRYASGKRFPEAKYIIEIASFFGVTTDWLLGLSDVKYSAFVSAPQGDSLDLLSSYEKASEKDKAIVRLILKKYQE